MRSDKNGIDKKKRNEYDRKLEEQEEQAIHYENMNYSNQNQNNIYRQQTVENESKSDEFDWRSQFANLSPKEKKRLIKKIEKEANEEYRKQYEDYFRSLGFRIKHRWTFKDFLIIGLVILVLAFIFLILWLIPPTHEWLLKLYNDNFVVNLFVRIILGICQGTMKFFQNLTKY